jgi:hypothetical protein
MYLAVSDRFYWPKIRHYIEKDTSSHDACQQTKPSRQLPGGLFNPLPVPAQQWEYVSMDYLTKLPHTRKGYAAGGCLSTVQAGNIYTNH